MGVGTTVVVCRLLTVLFVVFLAVGPACGPDVEDPGGDDLVIVVAADRRRPRRQLAQRQQPRTSVAAATRARNDPPGSSVANPGGRMAASWTAHRRSESTSPGHRDAPAEARIGHSSSNVSSRVRRSGRVVPSSKPAAPRARRTSATGRPPSAKLNVRADMARRRSRFTAVPFRCGRDGDEAAGAQRAAGPARAVRRHRRGGRARCRPRRRQPRPHGHAAGAAAHGVDNWCGRRRGARPGDVRRSSHPSPRPRRDPRRGAGLRRCRSRGRDRGRPGHCHVPIGRREVQVRGCAAHAHRTPSPRVSVNSVLSSRRECPRTPVDGARGVTRPAGRTHEGASAGCWQTGRRARLEGRQRARGERVRLGA